MKTQKRRKLEKAGWRIGSAVDFLSLTEAESAYVEMKLALARELSEARRSRRLTQQKLAAMLKTSQPRVAMMEKGDPSVSLDLLVRALLMFGIPAAVLVREPQAIYNSKPAGRRK